VTGHWRIGTTAIDRKEGPKFWWIDAPTDDENEQSIPEDERAQDGRVPELQAASVQSRIALGKRKGMKAG